MKKTCRDFAILFFIVVCSLFSVSDSLAAESKFRRDFRTSYEQNRFDSLGFLVRSNKAIMPEEISALVDEARLADTFQERMALLDLASAMATMYREWHGNGNMLNDIEKLQREEIAKEDNRKAELEKWSRYEAFPGNILMRTSQARMESQGLTPVLFPHWLHRLYFDCKACHQGIFHMKMTGSITKVQILEGKQCGVCHNGKLAFDVKRNCSRCHMVGKPGYEKLTDPRKADMSRLAESARRLGTGLKLEKLTKPGNLPIDKFGEIDWMLLRKQEVHVPLKEIGSGTREETRDSEILFESASGYVKNVLFSHKVHTDQLACSSCHKEIFSDVLGGTKSTKTEMSQGKSCGACHGKVSFKAAECNRCHSKPVGEHVPGALLRKK
jgi:c(7)-type cytochrome triheme protein